MNTTMTPEQLRELDVWIAVALFGWAATTVKCHPTDNRTIAGVLYSPNGYDGDLNQSSCVPHYTTDPAAALAVLEKCARQTSNVVITPQSDGSWIIHASGIDTCLSKGDALPLAIAFFARQIFSK